jgi:DNA-binding PadR family transcriptional regulator
LSQKESYGYELSSELKKKGLTDKIPASSIVYRLLRKLEKKKFVKSSWLTNGKGPAKRIYKITEKGEKLLNEWAEDITIKINSLNKFLAVHKKRKKEIIQ